MPHTGNYFLTRLPAQAHQIGRRILPQPRRRTTAIDRFLLLATIVLLPLQDYVPTVMGASIGFILFAVMGVYLVLWWPRSLFKTALHPVFLAGYAFVGIGLFMEFAHSSSGYYEIFQILLMILGGVLVASLCRDRRALLVAMYGTLLASGFLAVSLFLTSYGALSSVKAGDFQSASEARTKTFSQDKLGINLNTRAFLIVQGVVVALALALTTKKLHQRYLFLVIASFYAISSTLAMSRGGLVILVLSCATVLYAYGIMQPKVLIATGLLAAGVLLLVPGAVFSRFVLSTERHVGHEKVEARARIYMAVIEKFPEYFLTGVGQGNYYGAWGMRNGFTTEEVTEKNTRRTVVIGSHNCFAQVTLYWGLAGLLALFVLVWQAYRCLPPRCGEDPLRLCLLGIAVSVLLESLVVHNLYAKEFSLALGMMVGGAHWVWSSRIARVGRHDWRHPVRDSSKTEKVSSRLDPRFRI